ncbi:two-component regulator propeller domain-containing protein [Pedobacter frigiditerrae]|uniref:two-component regulator propeller domain-containing protein n=1 Tax=Pedobacter frigiditerrae TaxID=2530452 RepID=UPI00292F70E4|nr:two-component regulator propeller domain-containing protein [Pedobacter frigiditerrae]
MKNRLFIYFILCLFLTGFINLNVFAQSYPFKFNYLTVDEGLSHTDANDVAQDNKGYVWIATYFGLNRYDGYTIKKYYNNNLPLKNAFKNRISCLYPDQEGNIWLGTEDGLQRFDPKFESYNDLIVAKTNNSPRFSKIIKPKGNYIYGILGTSIRMYSINGQYLEEQKLNVPSNTTFSDITLSKNGILYLASNNGIWTLNTSKILKKVNVEGLDDEDLRFVYLDDKHHILTASKNQLFIAIKKTTQTITIVKQYTFPSSNDLKDVVQSDKGEYWVNNGQSLFRLDDELNLIQTINIKSHQLSLKANRLTKTLIDRSGCLWVGTFGGGVQYCDLNQKLFYTLQHDPEFKNSLSGNHVRSILADGNQLWIGTTTSGLNLYDLDTKKFTVYNPQTAIVKLKNETVTSMTLDNDRNLWIGSEAGIDILKPGRRELYVPAGSDKFPRYVIETLVKDYFGNIWFGNHTDKFGVIYKKNDGSYGVKSYGEGYFIFPDNDKPQIFVSSTNGLKRLLIDKEGNISKSFEYRGGTKPLSLSSDYTYPISKQNDSTYWIGTIGGGLNRLILNYKNNAYTIKHYGGKYGVFNDVESLEIDGDGNIWMGGNGLDFLNPKTEKLIRYDKNDGLQGNSFKVGSSFKGTDGRLYFGGINGLNYFNPKEIKPNKIAAKPILTDILINNQKPIYETENSSIQSLSNAIGYSDELEINYQQNNFIIYFSSMHFANPSKCKYRYKLVGFDEDWKFTDGNNPSASYSNLDFKSYKFMVQATNNDGIWSNDTAETAIIITPPWWKSNTAKTIYFFILIGGLAGIYILQARWYHLKREIAVREVNEKKREEMHKQREELSQQQLMFFTNISHEFRTPLTLILGPLENLINENKNLTIDNAYQLMYRNAKRLLNLISELMNFKKVADQVINLQVQPIPLDQFFKNFANEFEGLAKGKNIAFNVKNHTVANDSTPLIGTFDIQILEKILFNLLNNSFKYTNEGGSVSFEIFTDIENFQPLFSTEFKLLNDQHRARKYVYFCISDTGIGISSDTITRIFDRYYRISKDHLGSGIGLALVKSLTQLHKGDIYVYSEKNKGTQITIGIPLGEENYIEDEKLPATQIIEAKLEPVDNTILIPLAQSKSSSEAQLPKITKSILIVEDNIELRDFLKELFEKQYVIYEAGDGNSAMDIAIEKVPDLIISDVMMPGMNGIEFCKLVKETFETSHIPFIILSAKDAIDSKIEGMESGADFYFAKPLSTELLVLTVQNIFLQRQKLKERYADNYLAEATELVHSEKDKAFVHKLLEVIEKYIELQDLDVEFLCNHLFISRTKLYQKIKSVSNQSVGEFVRTVRLKKAIYIMTHEDVSISEVAERVGLQSISNFSRAFKKEYGKSPLQFIQALKEQASHKI